MLHNHHKNLDDIRARYNKIFAWKDQGSMAMFAKYSQYKASTDLKSATDRIPRKMIYYYLKYLVDQIVPYISKDLIDDFWTSNHENNPRREILIPELKDEYLAFAGKHLKKDQFHDYILS